jgi:hypothetical protein
MRATDTKTGKDFEIQDTLSNVNPEDYGFKKGEKIYICQIINAKTGKPWQAKRLKVESDFK